MNVKRLFAASLLSLAAGAAMAQAYPTKPVTIIVPWPPGGPSDIAARPLAKGLSEQLGKPFVVENRGGASGNIGTAQVVNSPPDGYTLLVTSSSPIVINPFLFKNMPFDPQKDLAPITNVLRVPLVLAVHPSVPAKNLKELIDYIKKQGGKFQYASAGNGTPQHLTAELFKTAAKLDMVHVPYKGSAPALTDALGGHVPMVFDSTVAIVPHLKAGKLRPIAIPAAARRPDVRRGRAAGRRILRVVRVLRARRHASGDHRQTQRHGAQSAEGPRFPECLPGDRLGIRRQLPGGVREVHQGGGGEMGEGGEGKRRDARLTLTRIVIFKNYSVELRGSPCFNPDEREASRRA
jgi:tripartite-type tricarboxylate transporter receptor subunit TctC